MIEVGDAYRKFMHDVFGATGDEWIQALPALVARYADEWSLTDVGPPFELSYNYVVPVRRANGTEAVLKISSPHGEHVGEIDALRLYNGRGVCQLLAADRQTGTLLLERLRPGTMLSTLTDDEEATAIAAQLVQALWQPAPAEHSFPTVADWFQGFDRHRERYSGTGPLDETLFATAESIVHELLATAEPPMVLHGDFHHFNILQAERAPWLVIDPKGLVGDPGYDLGAFLYNPADRIGDRAAMQRQLQRRVDLFSAGLGFERERVRNWGIAQAVLSAVWTCEGEGYGWEYTMGIAELLLAI